MCGKEMDKLNEAEEREQLQQDTEKLKQYNKAMEYIRQVAIMNLETWRLEFICKNIGLSIDEMLLINKYTDFLKERA